MWHSFARIGFRNLESPLKAQYLLTISVVIPKSSCCTRLEVSSASKLSIEFLKNFHRFKNLLPYSHSCNITTTMFVPTQGNGQRPIIPQMMHAVTEGFRGLELSVQFIEFLQM